MTDAFPFTAEHLQEHARSMRKLAQSLLQDADEAEDVVQEAWVSWLKRPAQLQAGTSVRSWLHAAAKNLARNRQRSLRRARRREAAYAQLEPSSNLEQDSAARAQVLQSVTEAVLALDEPYRSAVLLRFFECLPPREIARRHGVSTSTVKSRLQRALSKLRVQLARRLDSGDQPWREQLGLALGLPLALPSAPLPAAPQGAALKAGGAGLSTATLSLGVLLMKLKVIGVSIATLATLALGVYLVESSGPTLLPTPLESAEEQPDHPSEATLSALPRVVQAPVRNAISEEPGMTPGESAAPAARGEQLYQLSGTVFDADDRALPHAQLILGPAGHPLNLVGACDEEGRFQLQWRSQQSSMELVLGVANAGQRGIQLQRLRLQAGHTQELRLSTQPSVMWTVSIAQPSEGGLAQGPSSSTFGLLTSSGFAHVDADFPEARRGEGGLLEFVELPPGAGDSKCLFLMGQLTKDLNTAIATTQELTMLTNIVLGGVQRSGWLPTDGSLDVRSERSEGVHIEGRVFDSLGEPLEEVLVTLSQGARTRTDAQGRYRFEGLTPGPHSLQAGGGQHGRASLQWEAEPSATRFFDAYLDRGLELRLRLTDEDGQPLAKREVLLAARHPDGLSTPWEDRATSDEAGYVALPNCPRGALALYVFPKDPKAALPLQVFEELHAQRFVEGPRELSSYRSLSLETEPLGSLRFNLLDAQGAPLGTKAYARLSQVQSGLLLEAPESEGTSLERVELSALESSLGASEVQVTFKLLPPGAYRLELLAGPQGYLDLGTVFIAPGEHKDLGSLSTLEAARLVFQPGEGENLESAELELYRRNPTHESYVGALSPRDQWWSALAAGEYRLDASLGSRRASLDFSLAAAEAQQLSLLGSPRGLALELSPAELSMPNPQHDLESIPSNSSCVDCHGE